MLQDVEPVVSASEDCSGRVEGAETTTEQREVGRSGIADTAGLPKVRFANSVPFDCLSKAVLLQPITVVNPLYLFCLSCLSFTDHFITARMYSEVYH